MTNHVDMKMDAMGQKMTSGIDMDFRYLMSLEKIDSVGNNILKSTIGDMKFKIGMMGMSMGFDSKEKVDTNHEDAMSSMFRKIFSGMVNKSFMVTVGPKGDVLKVDGLEELVSGMMDAIPGTEESKTKMKEQLNQSFGEQQIKQSFGQIFNLYPDKPVKTGDSWNKEMDYELSGMKSKQLVTYKVKDITSDKVILDLKGDIKLSGNSQKDTSVTMPAMNIGGSENGTITLDRTSGLASSGDIDMTIKGDMQMKGKAMPMDMKVKISISNK